MLAELAAGRSPARRLLQLTALMALGGGVYGAILGSWRDPLQCSYAAVKLPLVLVATSALTLPFNWMSATILGLRLTPSHAAGLTFFALAMASMVLCSLGPVALLFTQSAPAPTPDARTAHNLLYLLHTAFVGASGLLGTLVLREALRGRSSDPRVAGRVHLAWVLSFALVGGEVAWVLRPFVGSVFMPVVFLRPDALQGNVYEFVVTDVAPHLLGFPTTAAGSARRAEEGTSP